MARYGYDSELRRREWHPTWYPGAIWASPMAGWTGWGGAGMWGWPPYAPIGYGRYPRPRRPPEESPTYGRRGDEAALRFARSHGYDEGYAIPPRFARRPRYDRGWRGYR